MDTIRVTARRFVLPILILVTAASASGATFSVTRADDPPNDGCAVNGCSLREAIIAANIEPGTDTIIVPAGSYTLQIPGADEDNGQTGDLDIRQNVVISGAGAQNTIVSAAGLDRVLHINIGVSAVAISDITFRDGSVTPFGGGIANVGGTLNLTRCSLVANTSSSAGGGYYQNAGRSLVAIESTFSGNLAVGTTGEDIYNSQGTMVLTNCTVSNADPSAVPIGTSQGTMTITNSTLVALGSVLQNTSSDVTLTNTALVGSCTVSGTGAFVSGGGNVESPGDTCGLNHPSDQTGVADSGLRPLGDYGGPNPTHAPYTTSPLIDAALEDPCPVTDQRGVGRPLDGDGNGTATCDCGAVEYEPPLFADDFETGTTGGWSSVQP